MLLVYGTGGGRSHDPGSHRALAHRCPAHRIHKIHTTARNLPLHRAAKRASSVKLRDHAGRRRRRPRSPQAEIPAGRDPRRPRSAQAELRAGRAPRRPSSAQAELRAGRAPRRPRSAQAELRAGRDPRRPRSPQAVVGAVRSRRSPQSAHLYGTCPVIALPTGQVPYKCADGDGDPRRKGAPTQSPPATPRSTLSKIHTTARNLPPRSRGQGDKFREVAAITPALRPAHGQPPEPRRATRCPLMPARAPRRCAARRA